MSKKLEQIRTQIDSLDNQIHDLLMERASLISAVSAEKKKSNRPIVHPAREAKMIRRLIGRHSGILPQAAIVGIWRELVGAVSMLQKGLNVHVSADKNQEYCWDMAKDYFGSVLPMNRVSSSALAMSAVRNDSEAIAVMPWPEDGEANPWWATLAQHDQAADDGQQISVVAGLPYGASKAFDTIEKKSVVIGRMEFNDSSHDHSFILIEVNEPLSRAKVIDMLKEKDLTVASIVSTSATVTGSTAFLAEVESYVAQDDKRMEEIQGVLEDSNGICRAVGGYPIPPIFREGDTTPISERNEAKP